MRVAFAGLGTMGAPMAQNILKRGGHALSVWNRTTARTAPLVAAGARACATPAEAARGAEVVLSMLADPAAVTAVYDGPEGLLAGLDAGAAVVDLSTVDPATARALAARVVAAGGHYLDAPVSGSRQPAVDGTLLILAGGSAEALARARPVLETMGRIVPVGGTGQGMAMKLVLNGLGAHMMTGLGAQLVLGKRMGLDPRVMLEVIHGGAFSSPLFRGKGDKIVARDFTPDFTLALMLKDQELVLSTARTLGYAMPSERVIRDLLVAAVGAGLGDGDLCGLVRLFESWAGIEV